ncbi:MAG: hypothetical protein JSV91_13190 [Phycisphaerales bacterium]|nr:MAG: hypothetical protein JSV91_13190 [Phycisphaerales bacterium]
MISALKMKTAARKRAGSPPHRLALGGAWFFIVFSLAALTGVMMAKFADPTGSIALYQASEAGHTHGAFALTYNGVLGLVQVMAQLVVISAAVIMSLSSKDARRRIAHGVLIVWAAVWMCNLIYLAGIEPRFDSVCQAPLMMLLFAGTGYRALRGWRRRPAVQMVLEFPSPAAEPAVGAADSLISEDVSSSPELREISGTTTQPQAGARRMRSRLNSAGRFARSGFARAGRIARGSVPIVKSAANRARPVVSAAGRGAAGLYGRTVRYLKDKAVIPSVKRSTAA